MRPELFELEYYMRGIALILAAAVTMAAPAQAAPDWAKVDAALGRPGQAQPDGVRRYAFPRSDLKVMLDGVAIKPALALGSWLAFQPMGDQVMLMGDLVLTETELNAVMASVLASGMTVTAIHNHLLNSRPSTLYMHVGGHGDPVKLATGLRAALEASATPLAMPTPPAAGIPDKIDLDTAKLDQTLGRKGKINGGVYQFAFPRAATPQSGGMAAPETMGTATAINFQPTGGGKAAITGDFVMTAAEVDPVMRALRSANIDITALHNHMLDDEPRLFFMHFWANADAAKLATGLRQALDKMSVAKP